MMICPILGQRIISVYTSIDPRALDALSQNGIGWRKVTRWRWMVGQQKHTRYRVAWPLTTIKTTVPYGVIVTLPDGRQLLHMPIAETRTYALVPYDARGVTIIEAALPGL